jgi:limonene-1,2-epoxide hydrolase
MEQTKIVNRRDFVTRGLGVAALVGLWPEMSMAQSTVRDQSGFVNMTAPTAAEKANLDVVDQFCKAWFMRPADTAREKLLNLMTPEGVWKIRTRPALVGREAVGGLMKTVLSTTRFDMNVFDTFARGDIVVNSRIDSNVYPDGSRTDAPYHIVGVFIMKSGKIAEWYEMLMYRGSLAGDTRLPTVPADQGGLVNMTAPTAAEQANLDVVDQFCKAWFIRPAEASREKMLSMMTPDGLWRIRTGPARVGHEAVGGLMKTALNTTRFDLNVFDTFARGDIVINTRIDSNVYTNGKPTDTPYPIAGVFVMKGGKIAEWYEMLMQRGKHS